MLTRILFEYEITQSADAGTSATFSFCPKFWMRVAKIVFIWFIIFTQNIWSKFFIALFICITALAVPSTFVAFASVPILVVTHLKIMLDFFLWSVKRDYLVWFSISICIRFVFLKWFPKRNMETKIQLTLNCNSFELLIIFRISMKFFLAV